MKNINNKVLNKQRPVSAPFHNTGVFYKEQNISTDLSCPAVLQMINSLLKLHKNRFKKFAIRKQHFEFKKVDEHSFVTLITEV